MSRDITMIKRNQYPYDYIIYDSMRIFDMEKQTGYTVIQN